MVNTLAWIRFLKYINDPIFLINRPDIVLVVALRARNTNIARADPQGVRFDPDVSQTLRLEFAKSNTKVSKPVNRQGVLMTGTPFHAREALRKCMSSGIS